MSYKKKSKQMFSSELLHWKLVNTNTTNTEKGWRKPYYGTTGRLQACVIRPRSSLISPST